MASLVQEIRAIYNDVVPSYKQLCLDCQDGSGYSDTERKIIREYINSLRKR